MLAGSLNVTPAEFSANSLEVNVYFETLNIETQTTDEAYSFVALLSDIGRQVGLFLGLSVISVLQFGDWIIKIMRGHDLSEVTRRVKKRCCSRCCHSATHDDENLCVESETSDSASPV